MKSATRVFFDEFRRLARYDWKTRLHGYIYARWIYQYIAIGTGEHPFSRSIFRAARLWGRLAKRKSRQADTRPGGRTTFADTYHGKVLTLDAAKKLVTLNRPINLPNLEKVVPYRRARDIILTNPDHLAVLQCPCRSARKNPCLPLDVCMVVGEPFVSFILEHHPHKARLITSGEALEILEAEHRRGHVAHAFFKDAMLDRFYAICNCCSCCCGAMQAQRNGTPMLASSGYVCRVDPDRCMACGQCAESCQFDAIGVGDSTSAVIDEERCLGCGVCVSRCPAEALSLIRDPARGEPLEIYRLLEQAASVQS